MDRTQPGTHMRPLPLPRNRSWKERHHLEFSTGADFDRAVCEGSGFSFRFTPGEPGAGWGRGRGAQGLGATSSKQL